MNLSFAAVFITLLFFKPPASENRISEAKFVPLGGIQQWITIRGEKANSPLLLILHGGPGDAQSSFTDVYKDYEKKFIVVQWDQRGAGKTFGKYHEQTPDLSIEQLVNDGIELAEYYAYSGKMGQHG